MKALFSILLTAGLSVAGVAQDISPKNVPSLVLNSFQSRFTNVTDVEWEMEGELYKVEFEINSRDHDAWITKNGEIRKHKEEISNTELPNNVRHKIEADFKGYTIDEVSRIEIAEKVIFEVELDGKDDREVLVSAEGVVQDAVDSLK